ncbi:MAG: hypothetical protein IPJ77_23155 [Planctomycetes bacterium]|nr:hypothetical protein [Planctomycetota bacterium]
MKDFFNGLVEQWKQATGATRGIVAIAVAAIAASVWWISGSATEPNFKLLYSNQDAQHAAAIQNALATGGIRYQASQPPGPFVIWVDESQFYQAQNLVALSGALETSPEGIQSSSSGASQVFLSANERQQNVLKREWQELEKQLQELDFVHRAHVSTSIPDGSPLRKSTPLTVAVTLSLKGNAELSRGQAQTVSKLVRYRFNVPAENVVISDQSGRSLFDGASSGELGGAAASLLEHKTRYELDLTQRTNQMLERVFGPGLAYVTLNSDWTFVQKERVKETVDPKNVVTVEKTENKTSTPQGASESGGSGGAASVGAGDPNPAGPAPAAVAEAKTSETKTSTIAGKETEHSRVSTPELSRLTVSLVIDESLREKFATSDQLTALESSIKNSVGFDDRRDAFSTMITPFATVKRDEQGQPVAPPVVEPESAPSPMVELVVQRGVEIVAAVLFLFVLMKALKGSPRGERRKTDGTLAAAGALDAGPEIDQNDPKYLDMLARRQIEELVKTEPEKVGTLLSRWVSDQETLTRA